MANGNSPLKEISRSSPDVWREKQNHSFSGWNLGLETPSPLQRREIERERENCLNQEPNRRTLQTRLLKQGGVGRKKKVEGGENLKKKVRRCLQQKMDSRETQGFKLSLKPLESSLTSQNRVKFNFFVLLLEFVICFISSKFFFVNLKCYELKFMKT